LWRLRTLIGSCWCGEFGTSARRLGMFNGLDCVAARQGLTGPEIADRVGVYGADGGVMAATIRREPREGEFRSKVV
jgi:hypothetical protein